MKTHRLFIALTALLLTAVSSQSSAADVSAADVSVDIVSIAPRNPDAVIAQIELNVLLKQFEKVLTQMEEMSLQRELENESIPSDATEDQKKQAEARHVKQTEDRDHESRVLQDRAHQCRARIKEIMSDANKRAAAFEKEQREAKQTTGQSQPTATTLTPSGPNNLNGGTVTVADGQNSLKATVKDDGKAPGTGTLRLTPGQPTTQAGTLNIGGGGTLILTADPNKAAIPPKASATAQPPAAK